MSESIAQREAGNLRALAEHFEQRDWDYTRLSDIRHIRYAGDFDGYDSIPQRIKRAVKALLLPHDELTKVMGLDNWSGRVGMARLHLSTEKHRPDGVLDGGGVIVHWEETGEYLQYVQPSVGSLIADWLEAEPDNPHAVKVAAEMGRLRQRYSERIDAGEVDGREVE